MNISREEANDRLQEKTPAHQRARASPESELLGVTRRWKGQSPGQGAGAKQPRGSHCSRGHSLRAEAPRIPGKAEGPGAQSKDRLTRLPAPKSGLSSGQADGG